MEEALKPASFLFSGVLQSSFKCLICLRQTQRTDVKSWKNQSAIVNNSSFVLKKQVIKYEKV